MRQVALIGYWHREYAPQWPNPRDFVDETWDASEREMVASYLASAPILANAYRGLSDCRLCGVSNGSEEYTDGAFLWPEGLSHYVGEHSVRLPRRVIDHIREHVGDFEQHDWRLLQREWPPGLTVEQVIQGVRFQSRGPTSRARITRTERRVQASDISWWQAVRPDG